MKIIEECESFAVKGNAMDLAVGVIIGAFLNMCLEFFIVAWAVFLLVKCLNKNRQYEATIAKAVMTAPNKIHSDHCNFTCYLRFCAVSGKLISLIFAGRSLSHT
ncbi:MAG: hypothetical protein EXS12_07960 [Phycisphaerales bacterium]|nr:hypothetical protein [Phycisphaerales bacterium]